MAHEKREVEVLTVSVPEAAKMVGISKTLAYRLIYEGKFPHKRIRGRLVVPLATLRAWIGSEEPIE